MPQASSENKMVGILFSTSSFVGIFEWAVYQIKKENCHGELRFQIRIGLFILLPPKKDNLSWNT